MTIEEAITILDQQECIPHPIILEKIGRAHV